MKVSLHVHGGFGGGLRRAPTAVDDAKLDAADAAQLRSLVDQARSAASPAAPTTRGADVQTYVIQIDGEGPTAELRGSDIDQTPEFRALRQFVEARG